MSEINIGETILRNRRAAEITQDDLAQHLGVTKAAVSKWEVGQSLPDIAQLPRIAAFFSISLDELLSYEPQLSDEELRGITLKIARLLHEDPEAAREECRRYVRDYYSCYPLLLSLGNLLLNGAARADGAAPDEAIAAEAAALFERVVERANDIALIRQAKWCLASISLMMGRTHDAITRLEELKPEESLGIEGMLASAYRSVGETEKAIRLQQEHVFWGVMAVMNGCGSLMEFADEDTERIDALVEAAEGVIAAFNLKTVSPVYEFSFRYQAAVAYKRAGESERAYESLDRFADMARMSDVIAVGKDPGILFDRIPDYFGVGAKNDEKESFSLMMEGLMELGIDQMLYSAPEWADVLDDPRFKNIAAKVVKNGASSKSAASSKEGTCS